VGNEQSNSFSQCTEPSIYPRFYISRTVSGLKLCCSAKCDECPKSAEAAIVHHDCFQVFQRHSSIMNVREEEVMDRLWVTAVWRAPWRHAPHLGLESAPTIPLPIWEIAELLEYWNVPGLPPEILILIRQFSADSLLWRYASVVTLVRHFASTTAPQDMSCIRLSRVAFWERGKEPVVAEETRKPPLIRVVIDSQGLKFVEVMNEPPAYQRGRGSRFMKYAVILPEQYEELQIQVKVRLDCYFQHRRRRCHLTPEQYGLARLALISTQGMPSNSPGHTPVLENSLQLWNTPFPPSLNDCIFFPAPRPRRKSTVLRTIDLSKITGLTFACLNGIVYGIHAHTETASCTEASFRHMSLRPKRGPCLVWLYLPLPPGDEVQLFGISRRSAVGDVFKGQFFLVRSCPRLSR
jgi:hypothetical protein